MIALRALSCITPITIRCPSCTRHTCMNGIHLDWVLIVLALGHTKAFLINIPSDASANSGIQIQSKASVCIASYAYIISKITTPERRLHALFLISKDLTLWIAISFIENLSSLAFGAIRLILPRLGFINPHDQLFRIISSIGTIVNYLIISCVTTITYSNSAWIWSLLIIINCATTNQNFQSITNI